MVSPVVGSHGHDNGFTQPYFCMTFVNGRYSPSDGRSLYPFSLDTLRLLTLSYQINRVSDGREGLRFLRLCIPCGIARESSAKRTYDVAF
ncbi:hypothetical protein K440DRAFT_619504 [Wilcoxina mikolae CBS 423.85]|nr:hypothetical protein K440DRAFT_619504 [Wilcoxina mikolae CBS 423.85]